MIDKNIRFTSPYCDNGFTLAEVLIALVVIGVIAAITMTTVMPNIQERANSQRQANIVYKVTQATNLMKANGAMVDGFASTDAFVDELQKYLKIMKRCDSEHIAECWPTKKVRTTKGKEYDVSKAKTRNQLGFSDDYKTENNVGIVLNDGASLIMTYNPINAGISIGEPLTTVTKELPVGGKYDTILEYTTNTTSGLAFVMDVNGGRGPNSETIGTKMYDIRNLNGAHFSNGCGGTLINNVCHTIIETPSIINCVENSSNEFCSSYSGYTNDYWAGAMQDCASIGATVPTQSELVNICKQNQKDNNLPDMTGFMWGSNFAVGENYVTQVRLSDCVTSGDYRDNNHRHGGVPKVLCIGGD